MSEPASAPAPVGPAKPNGADPARVEEMMARTIRFAQTAIRGSLQEPVDGVKRRIAFGAVGITVSVVLIGCALLLFLGGGVLLLAPYVSFAGAFLIVGAFALVSGVLAFVLTAARR